MQTTQKQTMFSSYPDVVDIKQLSEMLRITPKTCYKTLKNNEIPFRRVGREYRISKQAIIEYISNKNND